MKYKNEWIKVNKKLANYSVGLDYNVLLLWTYYIDLASMPRFMRFTNLKKRTIRPKWKKYTRKKKRIQWYQNQNRSKNSKISPKMIMLLLILPNKLKTQYVHFRSTQSTFVCFRKFLKKLSDNHCFSITKGNIYFIKHNYVHTCTTF